MTRYRRCGDGYGTHELTTAHLRVAVHRRATGWGWAQLFAADGTSVAVLEHLGEVGIAPGVPPARLEASEVRVETVDGLQRLVFDVAAQVAAERLAGTSFAAWVGYPTSRPLVTGTVVLELAADRPALRISMRLKAAADITLRYLRGPWLRVGEGEGSFGSSKDDALLPGVDWAVGQEWTSGSDNFRDPWALRCAPHPHQVSVPVMAVSAGGWAVGLSWSPTAEATGWFSLPRHVAQPVLASPNFIDRMPHHLLGLMLPSAAHGEQNAVGIDAAGPGLELHLHQQIALDAECVVLPGRSLDVLVDHVRRTGLPEPQWRWPAQEALDRIAGAYAGHLFHAGRGFGVGQTDGDVNARVPAFLDGYLERAGAQTPTNGTASELDAVHTRLRSHVGWCRSQPEGPPSARHSESIDALLEAQRPDGTFAFDPNGRHYRKDDVLVARDLVEPMGLEGDTALDLCVVPALRLLEEHQVSGRADCAEAAARALDACARWTRPEGGDYWETPLHAPNLLAAGHAAVAHEVGRRVLGVERYGERAVWWLRSMLAFTHLWEPAVTPMLYDTKPCLCSSDWYFANWVRDHVQWEVLEVFALSRRHGIDWAAVDPEIDWARFHEGVTSAAVRWLLDSSDRSWLPHNLPDSRKRYEAGDFDLCLPDTHSTLTGLYGGMAIAPDAVAVNLLGVLERREAISTRRLDPPDRRQPTGPLR